MCFLIMSYRAREFQRVAVPEALNHMSSSLIRRTQLCMGKEDFWQGRSHPGRFLHAGAGAVEKCPVWWRNAHGLRNFFINLRRRSPPSALGQSDESQTNHPTTKCLNFIRAPGPLSICVSSRKSSHGRSAFTTLYVLYIVHMYNVAIPVSICATLPMICYFLHFCLRTR